MILRGNDIGSGLVAVVNVWGKRFKLPQLTHERFTSDRLSSMVIRQP